MHLHSMTLQAIGPFAGRHTIDFAALGAGGLFLLEGPTGAGKSTLIDAIVFALYGKVASASTSEDRLRSGFAPEDVESVVDLVFETGAGVFRVRRTPAYDRAKRRGTGTVRQQAGVTLWRLPAEAAGDGADRGAAEAADGAADGEVLATRLDEAGAELQRIVGLDRQQFVQTVVLPQGEFASFLRADPEHRRGLLQKIFGTEAYEQLQQRLEEMRREAQRAVTDARAGLTSAVALFAGAAGELGTGTSAGVREAEAQEGAAGERAVTGVVADPVEAVALARERVDLLTERSSLATQESAAAERKLALAGAEVERLTSTVATVERRTALLAERVALDARTGDHTGALARRERARRATALRWLLLAVDAATAERAATEKEVRAALDAAPVELVGPELSSATPHLADPSGTRLGAHLSAAHNEAQRVVATLGRLVELEQDLPVRRATVATVRTAVEVARRDADALEQDLAARPEGRAALAVRLEVAAGLVAERPLRTERLQRAQATVAAARAVLRTDGERERALAAQQVAAEVALAAVRDEAHLRTLRVEGMAGVLAATLVEGDPCPVCGSTEHPARAALSADHVEQADIDQAERARTEAEQQLAAAGAALAGLTERVAQLRAQAGPGTLADAEEDVDRAQQLLAEATAAEADTERLRADLAAHDDREQRDRVRWQALVTSAAADRQRLTDLELDLAGAESEVAAVRGDHPSVAARRGAEQATVDAARTVLAALTAAQRADDDLATRTAELATAVVEHGFADAADARAATLPPAELEELDRAITEHTAAVERVRTGLAAPDVLALPPDLDPRTLTTSLAEHRARHEAARISREEAARVAALAADRVQSCAAALRQVESHADALVAALDRARPVTRMAGLATGNDGDNARALSLATYVLVRRFEDVVAAANDRLVVMSDGRFELERSEEREDVRTRRTGLAMRVVDHTTESARDPRTLSGGETFYVSLCLALGMADVVTAEAGGIDLGTLFVDEGFGSLDPHTLDAVLTELGRLRAGGRVVGVVSHVEALKTSIAERVEVRRCPDGSSTLTVRAG